MKLSPAQRRVLEATRDLINDSGADGYIPQDIGQRSTVRSLERRGLMLFVGHGICIDDSVPSRADGLEHPIYTLTEAGEREASHPTTTDGGDHGRE